MTHPADTIAVFGAGRADPDECALAERVGRTLARLGYAVANGGYAGTMEAVSRGARRAGGTVVGVVCRMWSARPNRFLHQVIATGDLHERLARLIELGTAGYVALPGGTGTLAELAVAWELAAKGRLSGRPLVCVGDYWRPLAALLGRSYPAAARRVSFAAGPGELAEHFPPVGAGA